MTPNDLIEKADNVAYIAERMKAIAEAAKKNHISVYDVNLPEEEDECFDNLVEIEETVPLDFV